jgi:hypothetical protein
MTTETPPKNTHGGAGRGQGRKPKQGELNVRYAISIAPELLAELNRRIASGKRSPFISEAIRSALDSQPE